MRDTSIEDRPVGRRRPYVPDPGVTFGPGPTTPAAGAPNTDPFGMFNDPSTNYLTDTIKKQLAALNHAPSTDPTTSWLMSFLTDKLHSSADAAPVSFDVGNGLLGDFINEGRQRIAELNQAPFTSAEEQALKTRTRNDLASQRDEARQRLTEDASRRGIGNSSGIVGQEVANLEGQTTAQDAKNQNDLMLYIADKTQERKNQAATIAQSLASAGQADAAMQMQGKIAAESANSNRQGQVMGIATALANMAAQQRGEARARQGDILQLSTLLAELPVQRLQLAANILNGSGGGNINSIFQDVLGLNNAQQGAQNQQTGAQASFLQALTALASYFANRK
jgi:hypothetical protein